VNSYLLADRWLKHTVEFSIVDSRLNNTEEHMVWSGKFTGSMAKRADQPNPNGRVAGPYDKQFGASPNVAIPLAVHHITDYAKLRDVWNRMVDDKHYATLCAWLYAVGFDVNNVFYETNQAQSPALIIGTMIKGGDIGAVADVDEIHQRVTWSTWNLVEGPKEDTRTDDWGNFHDTFANVVGLTDIERADMVCADAVFTAMAAMNLKAPVAKPAAQQLTKVLLGVNRNAQVIKYRPAMWSGSKEAGWRKRLRAG
jgi:hypothetical protein